MTHIDTEVNKGIGRKNQADAMVLIKHDFSKLEKDIEKIESKLDSFGKLLFRIAESQERQTNALCAPDNYTKLKTEIDSQQKNFLNTQQVAAICNVSKQSALRYMHSLAFKEPEKYAFRRCIGQAPCLIIRKQQISTDKIKLLTRDTVTVGKDSDMKKRDLALCQRGSLYKRS